MITEARLGDPDAIYRIAHEIGHMILHDHYAMEFSFDSSEKLRGFQDEELAEWQANRFAYHWLLPDHIVRALADPETIVRHCNVTLKVAKDRVTEVNGKRQRYEGEACPECANFTLVRNGTCLKCDTCGSTTGCS